MIDEKDLNKVWNFYNLYF